jgi:predicted Zn-dependent protease
MDPLRARKLALGTVETALACGAAEAEAIVLSTSSALTRFADNRIHQNVSGEDTVVSVRAVLGHRTGVASTNRADASSLRACCISAVDAARRAPEDPHFPGLPAPEAVVTPDRAAPATRSFGPEQRAEAVRAIVAQSSARGLSAAGQVSVSDDTTAVANSLGVEIAMPVTSFHATVLSTAPASGSGRARAAGGARAGAPPPPPATRDRSRPRPSATALPPSRRGRPGLPRSIRGSTRSFWLPKRSRTWSGCWPGTAARRRR